MSENKKCDNCGRIFYPKNSRALYCCDECRRIGRNKKAIERRYSRKGETRFIRKVCVICGSEFDTSLRRRVCCSPECQEKRHYILRKDAPSYKKARQRVIDERKMLISAGICTLCKKKKACKGHVTCEACTEKRRKWGREHYKRKVIEKLRESESKSEEGG